MAFLLLSFFISCSLVLSVFVYLCPTHFSVCAIPSKHVKLSSPKTASIQTFLTQNLFGFLNQNTPTICWIQWCIRSCPKTGSPWIIKVANLGPLTGLRQAPPKNAHTSNYPIHPLNNRMFASGDPKLKKMKWFKQRVDLWQGFCMILLGRSQKKSMDMDTDLQKSSF